MQSDVAAPHRIITTRDIAINTVYVCIAPTLLYAYVVLVLL